VIRKAEPKDISRIAEILVFTKRMKYRAIFHNDGYNFFLTLWNLNYNYDKAQNKAQVKAQVKAQSGALLDRDYLLLLLQENPTITQTELADVMGKSRRSIQMLMKQLIEDDVIERLGSKKQGTWILK